MVGADENRPLAESGKRNGKAELAGKKPEKRRRKPSQKTSEKSGPSPDALLQAAESLPEAPEPTATPDQIAPPAAAAVESPADFAFAFATDASREISGDVGLDAAATPADSAPVNYQAITDAYGTYTRKSLEQTRSFFEQLAGVRSMNRAFELQAQFAQQAYETFVSESRKIRELHSELARQRLRSLESAMTGRKVARSR